MRKVRLPKRSEDLDKIENYYTLEELKHFFKCVDDYKNPKMAIFFRLLAFTGARKSEVLVLQWKISTLMQRRWTSQRRSP